MRPGNSASNTLKRSATISGAWFGNITPPEPTRICDVIAAITSHMRVGSGGVMLPNHAPLMVAERFKVLEALFPGRIDLGLGRAPGTDQVTSVALRRPQDL